MPAAAVIPAPIAYIKVVAVKKLVVGFGVRWGRSAARSVTALSHHSFLGDPSCTSLCAARDSGRLL